MSLKVECRKFSPNIFNKQKCATCFKHKEEHSAEALDSNRASRKVQRCGFLFVAPDWDFTIPLNRTKRWQRRWFVLYDDGELTYSVDDHPETVPQGIIDMASVLEVANAEEVTGNSYSIALTASDRVTFIKGTCREEARWWLQALSMYVSLVKGRHKRNATFPGGRSTTTPGLNAIDSTDRVSCHTPPQSRRRLLPSLSAPPHRVQAEREHQPPVSPSPESPPPPLPLSPPPADSPPPPAVPEQLQRTPIRAETAQRRDAGSRTKPSESPPTQDRFRQHRTVTRCSTRANYKPAMSSPTCLESGSTRRDIVDGGALTVQRTRPTSISQNESEGCAYLSEYSLKREEKLKNIADSLTRPRPTRSYSYLSSIGHTMQSSRDTPTRDNAEDVISPSGPASISRIPDVVHTHNQLRDDPDGCAVVMETDGCYSNSLEQLRVDLPAEDLLHIKKGWLMKRNTQRMLVKHWFVLRGSSLIYYRDATAEDNSEVEGFVDLSRVQRVDECEAEKNYGFQLTTWEGAAVLLTAMTAGIRANWIQALRNAAKLLVSTATTSGALNNGEAVNVSAASQRLQAVTDERTCDSKYNAAVTPERDLPLNATMLPPVGSFVNQQHSSEEDEDDEYRTASETSAAGLDDDVDDDVKEAGVGDVIHRQSSARPRRQNRRSSLASSRSSIERSRSRSTSLSRSSSGSKRSRSSPPLSRRNNGSANRKPPLLDSSAGSANHRTALLDAHAGSTNHMPALLNAHAGSANHRSALLNTPAADRVDSSAGPHTTWALRKETLRSSLRSSLGTGTMLADQRDGGFSPADRPHMRSSLRAVTVPTGVTSDGESTNYSVGCHPEMSLVQRRRLAAAADAQQVEEWRSRANSLEDQVAQLLDQLQLLKDQLEEKNDQLKGAAELQERYSRLLDRHEQLQNSRDAAGDSEQWRLHYEKLEERYLKDHTCWESKLKSSEERVREMRQQQESHAETDKTVRQLNNGLKRAEGQLKTMRDQLEAAHVARTRDVQKLHDAASLKDIENSRLRDELQTLQVIRDSAKQDKSEVYKLKDLVQDLRSLLEDKTSELERQRREARDARQELSALRVEFESCQSRLQQGIAENETLTSQISELRRSTIGNVHPSTGSTSTMSTAYSTADSLASNLAGSASRESSCSTRQLSRFESLSDLTCGVTCDVSNMSHQSLLEEYDTLRGRFDTAIGEIRALKRQLRQAHVLQDQLELSSAQTVAQLQAKESCQISESQLMTERLQDLTSKLANAEKQLRQLKPKLTRGDVKDRRRTSSLKGRDSFPSIPRELETKLQDLEQRVTSMEGAEKQQLPAVVTAAAAIEAAAVVPPPVVAAAATVRTPRRFEESTKSSRLRRKSLDSATAAGDSLRFIMRVNALEQKVSSVGGQTAVRKSQRARSAELRRPSVVAGEPRAASPDHRAAAAAAVTREEEEAARAKLSRLESTVVDIKDGIDACVIELQDVQVSQVTTVCSRLQSLSAQLVAKADSSLLFSSSSRCSASTAATAAQQLASRTSCLLQSSFKQLAVEELELRAASCWSSAERRKLAIRRFACQTVLAACLAQVHQQERDGDDPAAAEGRLKLQQLLEVHRKVSELQRRLEAPEEVDDSSSSVNSGSSMIGTFVPAVANKLAAVDDLSAAIRPRNMIRAASTKRVSPALQQDQQLRHLHDILLKRQAEVTSAFEVYRTESLQRLAKVLVEEAELSGNSSSKDQTSPKEEVVSRMRSQAHDNIAQAMAATQMASTMGGVISSDDRMAEMDQHSAVLLSNSTGRRYELSVQHLQSEMERTTRTLNELYDEAVSQREPHLSEPSTQSEDRPLASSSRRLLSQLTSVVAQKSLVDGYVQALAEFGDDSAGCCSSEALLGIIEEDATTNGVQEGTPTLRSLEDAFDGDSALELFFHGCNSSSSEPLDRAQFQMLYRSAVERCRVDLAEFAIAIPAAESMAEFCERTQLTIASVREESRTKVKQITEQHQLQVKSLEKELEALRRMRVRARSADKSRRRVSDITGMVKSSDIVPVTPLVDDVRRQQLSLSRSHSTVTPSQSTLLSDVCQRCRQLQAAIESSNSEHAQELETLRKKQDSDLEDLRREMTQEVEKVTATYEAEKQQLGGEVEQLRRRLQLLETEYAAQIQLLNDQYQARERAGKEAEDAMVEENIRRRYQAEIEQLRGLCEKGLVAMENSHRRIIAELGEKHRRELHSLEADKQKALAEETQATLAALDALRKAHQNEVQKEVAKFKEEFISRMEPGLDIGKMHQEHTAEMEDIKSEILGLSEKYSIKCLESASLEEKVDSLSRNLQQANLQTFQLDARNKQFRAQLAANITELSRLPREQRTPAQQMALLENQLTCAQENAQRLQQELLATQKREVETTGLCRQLSTYLRAERQLRADEVSSLRERLEHIILTSSRCTNPGSSGGRAPTDGSGGSSDAEERSPRLRRGASLTSARIKELMRSPSCPRLSGYLAVSGETSTPRIGSPLYGMVASRKMAFEKRLRHK